jgi:hypothetical protein
LRKKDGFCLDEHGGKGKTSTLRLITFSGKKDDWEQWNKKTLSLCRRGKYRRSLTTNLAAIYALETDDDEKEKLAKVNADTYDHLMLSLNGTEFGIVSNAISKEFPQGDANAAWKLLFDKFEPSEKEDLAKIEQDWASCHMVDKDFDNIDDWFHAISPLQERLRAIDEQYIKKDFQVLAHLFNGLDEEIFSDFKNIYRMDYATKFSVESFKKILHAYYSATKRTKSKGGQGKTNHAFYQKQFKGTCRKCGKYGHKAADCRSGGGSPGGGNSNGG